MKEGSKEWMIERAGKLKEEARPLFGACNNILEKMKLVDTIQHLGIDHMFEEEIDFALHEIQENGFTGSSLYEVALRFCLLREHSLWVSPDVFNKFKGEDGMFRNDIANDTRGLLSLYNAAYLLIPGEDELDEAISFARWWKDLYDYVGLSYSRQRPVETYTWSCINVHEERFGLTRVMLAKMVALFSFMDDTYDNKADIHECRRLNTAIQRWNEDASYLLPEYLRKFYIRLLSNFKEMEEELPKTQSIVLLARRESSKKSQHVNFGQPNITTEISSQTLKIKWPCLLELEAVDFCLWLGRFMNDIAAFKLGTNKTDVASVVEWYFHENKVTSDIALAKIESIVEEQWKIINKARFGNPVLFPVMKLAIKIAVGIFFFNQDRCDHFMFNTEQLRETMLNLYVNPIPI
ncbi:hypothetical protein QOZ80_9AG0670570 [Eleusine coracana subsp. coracana]|nr:hypothetical protein QOZ80_9AG0670570 [Eleusine coracana subsp. coracana]